MSLSTLLVDARPVDHPTARQRGIGRYVTGLLAGLRDIDVPVIALYGNGTEAEVLDETVPGLTLSRWNPRIVREHAVDDTWYLATQLMLHPIPLDPIPRCITAARLPVAALMYDVIPYRHPDIYLIDNNARRQAELRAPLAERSTRCWPSPTSPERRLPTSWRSRASASPPSALGSMLAFGRLPTIHARTSVECCLVTSGPMW